jgi:hypothetical protein
MNAEPRPDCLYLFTYTNNRNTHILVLRLCSNVDKAFGQWCCGDYQTCCPDANAYLGFTCAPDTCECGYKPCGSECCAPGTPCCNDKCCNGACAANGACCPNGRVVNYGGECVCPPGEHDTNGICCPDGLNNNGGGCCPGNAAWCAPPRPCVVVEANLCIGHVLIPI